MKEKNVIRGNKTLPGLESEAALLVVEGVIVDKAVFGNISPLDVELVDFLKDTSSLICGSWGAKGVVLVEILKGR